MGYTHSYENQIDCVHYVHNMGTCTVHPNEDEFFVIFPSGHEFLVLNKCTCNLHA